MAPQSAEEVTPSQLETQRAGARPGQGPEAMPNFRLFCPKSYCHPRGAAAEPSSGTACEGSAAASGRNAAAPGWGGDGCWVLGVN